MSLTADSALLDLRDYEVDGVVESGPHTPLRATIERLAQHFGLSIDEFIATKPIKAEMRALVRSGKISF